MRKFAEEYPFKQIENFIHLEEEMKSVPLSQKNVIELLDKSSTLPIVQQGVAQLKEQTFLNSVIARLSWSHHIILMDKVADQGKRLWYMLFTMEHGVSRNVLAIQM